MELAQEEFMGSNDLTQIIKGKRTKRQRSSSPPHKAGMVSSGSSSGCGHDDDGGGEEYGSISSHTSCSEVYHESTEEEEDMANCLILLAQGEGPRLKNNTFVDENNSRIEKFSSRKFSQVSTASTTNKAGFYVYECKTCNRSFPSFQALGGHRASHKKPKPEEKKVLVVAAPPPPPPPSILMHDDDGHDNLDDCQLNKSSTSCSPDPSPPLALQISNINNKIHSKAKIHECSICGSEFTSGQALGGHMRRHRANTTVNNNQVVAISGDDQIKPRTILSLDLNLPAPEDDHHHRESKFQFVSTPQALVFSAAPALVDCHY